MEMISKEKGREKIEEFALNLIMKKTNQFKLNDIMLEMRALCYYDIETSLIEEIVYNAIDFLMLEGYVDICDSFTLMVDPVKQIEYQETGEIVTVKSV